MTFSHAVQSMWARNLAKVRAINKRYAEPRLVMSPLVRAALMGLRIYLLVLVALLAYKFFTLVA